MPQNSSGPAQSLGLWTLQKVGPKVARAVELNSKKTYADLPGNRDGDHGVIYRSYQFREVSLNRARVDTFSPVVNAEI